MKPTVARCALALSPKGERVATLGTDQAVRLWDVKTGQEIARYGHPHPPTSVAYSPDGKQLVITSDDITGGLVRVWAVPTK